ncbi:MAG: PAS domain S-box protein [Chitinophagaceae bacterium]|nr:PAS domain S-box protein [Chitinophagaceae bacterium]
MYIPDFKHSADDLLTLFELTPDLVCVAGKDGYFRNFNPAVPQTLEYTREELFSSLIEQFIHPDDRERTSNRRSRLLQGEALLNFQNRYITKTGKIVWLEWTSVYLPEKEIVFALAKNITARKEIEEELQAQFVRYCQLASDLKTHIEEDRKYVAAELHEELAQLASVVKVDLNWISSNTTETSESVKARIQHANITAELLVDTIRRLSFSISPLMLDDLGLDAALEWYCKEFEVTSGITCAFKSKYREATLNKNIRLDVFRICQEVLTNIKKYAGASSIQVGILEIKKNVILHIADDGKGFDQSKEETTPGGLSIYERAAMINAKIKISPSGFFLEF